MIYTKPLTDNLSEIPDLAVTNISMHLSTEEENERFSCYFFPLNLSFKMGRIRLYAGKTVYPNRKHKFGGRIAKRLGERRLGAPARIAAVVRLLG